MYSVKAGYSANSFYRWTLTPPTYTIGLPATLTPPPTRPPLPALTCRLFRVTKKLRKVPGPDALFLSCLRVWHPPSLPHRWIHQKCFVSRTFWLGVDENVCLLQTNNTSQRCAVTTLGQLLLFLILFRGWVVAFHTVHLKSMNDSINQSI